MKRLCSLLTVLTLLAALTVPAFADIIWEPENDFWRKHRSECTSVYDDRREAQTDAAVYGDPKKSAVTGTIPAGTELAFQWLWKDGAGGEWGYAEQNDGWVRLTDFRRLYTESVFRAEHADDIFEESGALPYSAEQAFYSYTFPGSGETSMRFGGQDSVGADDPNFRYDETYTDDDGRIWGVTSFSGKYRFWVCLTDPFNPALPRTAPKYAEAAAPAPVEPAPVDPAPAPAEPIPAPAPVVPTPAPDDPAAAEIELPVEILEPNVGTDAPPAPADPASVEHPAASDEPAPLAPAAEQEPSVGLIAGLVAAVMAATAALLALLRRKKETR